IHPRHHRDGATINGLLSILIDPTRLGDGAEISREVDLVLDYMKSAAPIDPAQPVLVAGEPERRILAERSVKGIPIDAGTWADLKRAGSSVDLDIDEFIS